MNEYRSNYAIPVHACICYSFFSACQQGLECNNCIPYRRLKPPPKKDVLGMTLKCIYIPVVELLMCWTVVSKFQLYLRCRIIIPLTVVRVPASVQLADKKKQAVTQYRP